MLRPVPDNQYYPWVEEKHEDKVYQPCFESNGVKYYENILKIRKQYLAMIKQDKIEPKTESDYHNPKEDIIVQLSTLLRILGEAENIKVEDVVYSIADFWSLIKGMKLTSGPSDFIQYW